MVKRREANFELTDENIAHQYENVFDGLQKDTAQNAWDARVTRKGKDWKLLFKYEPQSNILIIEDFCTTGMDEGGWSNYQNLWYTDKRDTLAGGSRGQGKFIFHYFSKDKTLLTETIDQKGKYRFSWGTTKEYDESKSIKDYLPQASKLNHQGTRIWILNIKDELKSELIDKDNFANLISASWWEIIRNYGVTFAINFNGTEKIVKVPKMPPAQKNKHFEDEEIKKCGKVRNLELNYSSSDVPELFQGIAVQRDGMTICRLQVRADETLKRRIYGYCNLDEPLEKEIKDCELPNHMGFRTEGARAWNYVRRYIDQKLEGFVLEISPKKEQVKIDKDVVDMAIKLTNKIIYQYTPELLESKGKGDRGGNGRGEDGKKRKKPNDLLISNFAPKEKKIEYGDSLELLDGCKIVNRALNRAKVRISIKIYHEESGYKKFNKSDDFEVSSQGTQKIDMGLLDFDKDEKPGKYIAEAYLKENGSEIDYKRFIFYVHEDPPGKQFVTEFLFINGKGQAFEKRRNLPINENGKIHIIADYPEFVHIRECATKKTYNKEVIYYATKCGLSEAIHQLATNKIEEGEPASDVLKELREKLDEMVFSAFQTLFD